MVTHYLEFLRQAHEALQPRGYLEIGVRYGSSLRLAQCPAIGIDPVIAGLDPAIAHKVIAATSDEFFASEEVHHRIDGPIDLAFIDGMHLIEYAMRDFLNVEKYANPGTVIMIDDVLPYSQAIAGRIQPAGDWTGDVWKMIPLLHTYRSDLSIRIVNTLPTGMLMVSGFGDLNRHFWMEDHMSEVLHRNVLLEENVPGYIIGREGAEPPDGEIMDSLTALRLFRRDLP